MRLDHIAYRTADRNKTAQFLIDAFGYRRQTEFEIVFDDGETAKCIALEPPEKDLNGEYEASPIIHEPPPWISRDGSFAKKHNAEHHLPPEIFVSDGTPDSIVGKWVAERGGIGGVHHVAYQVRSVQSLMDEWQEKGLATFASDKPLTCPGLVQVFTTPHELTGIIYEFIERHGEYGFCKENVKSLMESTRDLK